MTAEERDRRYGSLCRACGDGGAVVVPHPDCVDVPAGRLTPWPGGTSVRTIAVRCTALVAPGVPCRAGDARFANLPGLDRYTAAVGGLDGPGLLRDWEGDRAAEARAGQAGPLFRPTL